MIFLSRIYMFIVHCFHLFITANLVERNAAPNGYELLNPNYVGKHNAFDLVALATEIQNADVAVNHHSGKLSLIIDQVSSNRDSTVKVGCRLNPI